MRDSATTPAPEPIRSPHFWFATTSERVPKLTVQLHGDRRARTLFTKNSANGDITQIYSDNQDENSPTIRMRKPRPCALVKKGVARPSKAHGGGAFSPTGWSRQGWLRCGVFSRTHIDAKQSYHRSPSEALHAITTKQRAAGGRCEGRFQHRHGLPGRGGSPTSLHQEEASGTAPAGSPGGDLRRGDRSAAGTDTGLTHGSAV